MTAVEKRPAFESPAELVPLLRTLSERYARAAAGGRVDA